MASSAEQREHLHRSSGKARWLRDLASDLRYGARQLFKHSGFTTVVVVSLALGVGATTAIFSIANDFLWRPLPVKNPGELVRFLWVPGSLGRMPRAIRDSSEAAPASGRGARVFSLRTFERFREERPTLCDLFAFSALASTVVTIDGQAEYVDFGLLVSGNYYGTIGVPAIHGRTIAAADDTPGAPPVAVISHRFWQTHFAGAIISSRRELLEPAPIRHPER
jgi:hypothetical protein